MKSLILLLGLVSVNNITQKPLLKCEPFSQNESPQSLFFNQKQSLCVVFYQDVSGSIKQNGVEIVSSSVFVPIFNDINRNIELHFGIIDDLTAHKLITLTLPAIDFVCPILLDLRQLTITEKRREKQRFLSAEKQYITDSIRFYSDRKQRIADFCKKIDLLLSPYKSKLSSQTDLITALDIADKVFSYSAFGATKNYLLLNSDGLDSFKRNGSSHINRATVILINAGKKQRTSIDPIITMRLESPEQAIHFTLTN